MTPLDQIRQELAQRVYDLLDAHYPRYRLMPEGELGHSIEKAVAVGVVRWALMCHDGNQSKASIRCGINRNTLRKILNESLMLEEEAKYAKALGEINKPRQRIGTY